MGFALSDMQLTSAAFAAGGAIPARFSGEDADVSPPLAWDGAPADARAFVVLCHDPDAPLVKTGSYGFVHWVLYGIPGEVRALPEAVDDYIAGVNDFGNPGYGGPMPPEGHGRHHYFFWVLALDADPELPAGLSLPELLERIEPHVVAMNRLVGTYERG
jgi:hypothetical protein